MAERESESRCDESDGQFTRFKRDELVRAHVLVTGRVQGVAFRAFTQDEARRLNLKGWVRNLSDGRVEAEVEGGRSAVDTLLVSLRQGPPLAHVEQVQVNWKNILKEIGEFRIVR